MDATPPQAMDKISLTQILGLLLRHGQCLLVYPLAFDQNRRWSGSPRTPAQIGIPYIAPLLRTPDGVQLSCYLLPQTRYSLASPRWSIPMPGSIRLRQEIVDEHVEVTEAAADAAATVIVFHGNAAHNWEDMESAEDMFRMRCNVLLASYRGYSLSTGSPTERGGWKLFPCLRMDAQTTLNYVLDDPYLSKTPIILYGHSLGGAVAVDLASRNPTKISGLILSNTFTSIPDIVRDWSIIGPFSFLCTQRWNSASKLRRIPVCTPILMLSGRQDEVVPAKLMDRLWEVAARRGTDAAVMGGGMLNIACGTWCGGKEKGCEDEDGQKKMVPVDDVFERFEKGKHCDTPNLKEYWGAVSRFVDTIRKTTNISLPAPPRRQHANDIRWRHIEGKLITIIGVDV